MAHVQQEKTPIQWGTDIPVEICQTVIPAAVAEAVVRWADEGKTLPGHIARVIIAEFTRAENDSYGSAFSRIAMARYNYPVSKKSIPGIPRFRLSEDREHELVIGDKAGRENDYQAPEINAGGIQVIVSATSKWSREARGVIGQLNRASDIAKVEIPTIASAALVHAVAIRNQIINNDLRHGLAPAGIAWLRTLEGPLDPRAAHLFGSSHGSIRIFPSRENT